jgi:flavin reductase (DIM6/NTAB) family NADH-FMN oxidoreductase RutF
MTFIFVEVGYNYMRGEYMSKTMWKPGTMLYPVPAVMVTSKFEEIENIITISWAGTICTNPPMVSISVRPERFSYDIIKKSREFVINIPGKDLAFAADFSGVRSGREVDKFEFLKLSKEKANVVSASLIKEAPISIECKVKDIIELGSHHMFIADVVAVNVEESLIDEAGKLHLDKAELICYNHGEYAIASKPIGTFGFSVRKKKKKK